MSPSRASHRHSGNCIRAPPKLPFTLPELTFLGLGHALPEEDAPTWKPTPEMFTLLLQSLGVLPIEPTNALQQQQQQEPLVTIAVAQELDLSPTHGQHKSRLPEKSPCRIFESERDPLSQQYVLTTSDVEHKYLCKIFTDCDLFQHPAVKVPRERRLDAMKRLVQTAINNELGAVEWVRTEWYKTVERPHIYNVLFFCFFVFFGFVFVLLVSTFTDVVLFFLMIVLLFLARVSRRQRSLGTAIILTVFSRWLSGLIDLESWGSS